MLTQKIDHSVLRSLSPSVRIDQLTPVDATTGTRKTVSAHARQMPCSIARNHDVSQSSSYCITFTRGTSNIATKISRVSAAARLSPSQCGIIVDCGDFDTGSPFHIRHARQRDASTATMHGFESIDISPLAMAYTAEANIRRTFARSFSHQPLRHQAQKHESRSSPATVIVPCSHALGHFYGHYARRCRDARPGVKRQCSYIVLTPGG